MVEPTNQGCFKFPWETKINKLYWRGSGTDQYYTPQNWTQAPMGKLVNLSHLYPDLIDAGFFHMYSLMVSNFMEDP